MLQLQKFMTPQASLKDPLMVYTSPYGTRIIYEVASGSFYGEHLQGKVLTSGGGWLLIDAQGVRHLDIRATMETADGAFIYLPYLGLLIIDIDDKVQAVLSQGGEMQYGETYFIIQPRFKTGHSSYQ